MSDLKSKTIRYGGIEAGGTSFAVSLAYNVPTNIRKLVVVPTTTPEETINAVATLLHEWNVDAIGIASFGPVDLDKQSPTYGYITSTPKQYWMNVDLVGGISRFFQNKGINIPIGFDTDVNAAALAEIHFGEHGPVSSLCYITVGTGIGVGICTNGDTIHGLTHPEAGHIPIRRHPKDTYEGSCPYHGDCLEGLCNAFAISSRLGIHASELSNIPEDHEIWQLVGYYLAQLCTNLVLICSPHLIILGGGVLRTSSIYKHVHSHVLDYLNGYIQTREVTNEEEVVKFIKPSMLNQYDKQTGVTMTAGAVGALYLASRVHEQTELFQTKNISKM